MRPQPVMPSRSLTSAALRTPGCVPQRDRPAPPRPLRPHANLEQARCRRSHGVDSSRLCSHEDSVVIAVDVKSEHRIVPDATAMLGRNDPSALLAPDEDGAAIFADPHQIRHVNGSAGWRDLADTIVNARTNDGGASSSRVETDTPVGTSGQDGKPSAAHGITAAAATMIARIPTSPVRSAFFIPVEPQSPRSPEFNRRAPFLATTTQRPWRTRARRFARKSDECLRKRCAPCPKFFAPPFSFDK